MWSSNDVADIPVAAINALSTRVRANCSSFNTRLTLIADKTANGQTGDRTLNRFIHALAHGRKLLSIGDDLALLRTRQMVLESVGFDVCSVSSAGVIEEAEMSLIDVALLCHTVEQARASAITNSLRRINPELSILQLCKGYGGGLTGLEQIPSDAPEHMLQEIERVLERKYDMTGSVSHLVKNRLPPNGEVAG